MGIDRTFYGMDLTGDTCWVESRKEGPFPVEVTKRKI